jgi:hypothetical protein
MTKAQIKKLDSIIGRLEMLQGEVSDPARYLGQAKTILMDFLRDAEEAAAKRSR